MGYNRRVKRYVPSAVFFAAISLVFLTPQAHAAWHYSRSFTVTSTASVASGTNANFPMLVSSTLSSWEASSTGGRIQNLCTAPNGSQEPCDLIFATSTACNTLNFETESYSSSTGALVDWVNVPSVSTGTVIYACYGNTAITTDQSHPSSTWNPNYISVYHLSAPTGTVNVMDSTANRNSGANNGATATTTIIDGGGAFNGTSQYVNLATSTSMEIYSNFTVSGWVRSIASTTYEFLISKDNSSGARGWDFGLAPGQLYFEWNATPELFDIGPFLNDGNWHFIVGEESSSSAAVSEYADGAFVISTTVSPLTPNSTADLYIGGREYSGALDPFPGAIDEVNIVNGTLSPQWIATEYNNQSTPSSFYALGNENSLIDTTPPSVTLTSPLSGATVSSTISIVASSTDNVAVQGVQFQIDGVNLGSEITATSGPTLYSTTWNTTSSTDGAHVITAIAYDTSNNSSTATSSVTVSNAVQSNPPPSTPIVSVGVPASYGIPNYQSSQTSTNVSSPPTQPSIASLEATIASLTSEFQSLLAEVPATMPTHFTRNLSLWNTGPDIQALQAFLIQTNSGPNAQKLKDHGTTQVFGYLTYNALREYQQSAGLPATGYFGSLTRGEVNRL